MPTLRIALVQMDLAWEDAEENHRRAARHLDDAAARGARLVLLPEMFSTGFSMETERIAQAQGGASEAFLVERAAALDTWILASVPQKERKESARARNVALLVSPGGAVTRYAKIHPFSYAGEDRHYEAGDRVVTAEVDGVRVTPLVCYDLRFPEPFRVAARETDLFCVVANWPDPRREHWRTLLRARAIENQAYVAGVNRAGEGGGGELRGRLRRGRRPLGETLAEAGAGEAVVVCDVDTGNVTRLRAKFPALDDIRPEAYRRGDRQRPDVAGEGHGPEARARKDRAQGERPSVRPVRRRGVQGDLEHHDEQAVQGEQQAERARREAELVDDVERHRGDVLEEDDAHRQHPQQEEQKARVRVRGRREAQARGRRGRTGGTRAFFPLGSVALARTSPAAIDVAPSTKKRYRKAIVARNPPIAGPIAMPRLIARR